MVAAQGRVESSDYREHGVAELFDPILTDRLTLREWSTADLPAAYAYASDPAVVQFMPFGPQSKVDCEQWLSSILESQTWSPRTRYDFAVVVKATGEVIGNCDLTLKHEAGRVDAEVGYIYRQSAWGNGYATEAANAVIEFNFLHLNGHRVYATVDLENLASIRVMEKIGMRREGLLVGSFQSQTGWRDHYLFAILDTEWRS